MNLTALKDKRNQLVADVRARFERAENGVLDADSLAIVRQMNKDIESLDEQISIAQRAYERDAEARAQAPETQVAVPESRGRDAREEYRHYLRTGEARAQLAGNNALGGYLVDADGFIESMVAAGPILSLANVLYTDTGAPLTFATLDGTSVVAGFASEGAATANAANLTFGSVTLSAYTAIAGPNPVSLELMTDGSDIVTIVNAQFSEQFARNLNQYSMTGTGTSQPTGIFNVAATSTTAASNTGISSSELISFQYSLDPAYSSGAAWVMHPTTASYLRQLTANGSGQYLWVPGFGAQPDTLLGKPVYVSSYVDQIAASKKVVAYGDFKRGYTLRIVRGFGVTRLNEAFATSGCIGFVGRMRWDGKATDSKAIKILATKS